MQLVKNMLREPNRICDVEMIEMDNVCYFVTGMYNKVVVYDTELNELFSYKTGFFTHLVKIEENTILEVGAAATTQTTLQKNKNGEFVRTTKVHSFEFPIQCNKIVKFRIDSAVKAVLFGKGIFTVIRKHEDELNFKVFDNFELANILSVFVLSQCTVGLLFENYTNYFVTSLDCCSHTHTKTQVLDSDSKLNFKNKVKGFKNRQLYTNLQAFYHVDTVVYCDGSCLFYEENNVQKCKKLGKEVGSINSFSFNSEITLVYGDEYCYMLNKEFNLYYLGESNIRGNIVRANGLMFAATSTGYSQFKSDTENNKLIWSKNKETEKELINAFYNRSTKCNELITGNKQISCRFEYDAGEFNDIVYCYKDIDICVISTLNQFTIWYKNNTYHGNDQIVDIKMNKNGFMACSKRILYVMKGSNFDQYYTGNEIVLSQFGGIIYDKTYMTILKDDTARIYKIDNISEIYEVKDEIFVEEPGEETRIFYDFEENIAEKYGDEIGVYTILDTVVKDGITFEYYDQVFITKPSKEYTDPDITKLNLNTNQNTGNPIIEAFYTNEVRRFKRIETINQRKAMITKHIKLRDRMIHHSSLGTIITKYDTFVFGKRGIDYICVENKIVRFDRKKVQLTTTELELEFINFEDDYRNSLVFENKEYLIYEKYDRNIHELFLCRKNRNKIVFITSLKYEVATKCIVERINENRIALVVNDIVDGFVLVIYDIGNFKLTEAIRYPISHKVIAVAHNPINNSLCVCTSRNILVFKLYNNLIKLINTLSCENVIYVRRMMLINITLVLEMNHNAYTVINNIFYTKDSDCPNRPIPYIVPDSTATKYADGSDIELNGLIQKEEPNDDEFRFEDRLKNTYEFHIPSTSQFKPGLLFELFKFHPPSSMEIMHEFMVEDYSLYNLIVDPSITSITYTNGLVVSKHDGSVYLFD
ncbi:hypothetical protein ECANGB1_1708 [Enterospora canceri]|uniref:Uncharacterized protein n=1 Tax=Enterospora canceri TaxID=1081671 RepID=A0A1Y1SAF6_9MICR|nr:hypothetical protein ECANGB1_1708 [Enterospora canceri]